MKKSLWSIWMLLLVLAGCTGQVAHEVPSSVPDTEEPARESRSERVEGDFVYRLVSEQGEYAAGEQVQLYAELEYTGEEDEITISHAASPFWFPIRELTREYDISYGMNEPLLHTTLKKGEPLREYYKGAYGYNGEDSDAYKQFIKSLDNGFPEGRYVVYGSADFLVQAPEIEGEAEAPDVYKLTTEIEFVVK
ncbi:hypothetical protein MKX64_06845 [Paenibacillus sp. FSL M8-0334]|uniref:hypothetical protein n=1 Tax=Paenibacillus sp. FSL M8-0334 TaxID=2921623 RepID=UPI0030FCBF9E